LTLPVLVAAAGMAIDYGLAAKTRSNMQAVADSAALASVTELQLARSDSGRVTAVARNFVNSALKDVNTSVDVDMDALTVKVSIDKHYTPFSNNIRYTVARQRHRQDERHHAVVPAWPRPDRAANHRFAKFRLADGARLPCAVELQRSPGAAIVVVRRPEVRHDLLRRRHRSHSRLELCTEATTDCPVLPDPLRSRVPPSVGACNFNNMVVNGGNQNLSPGVYCGGLKLTTAPREIWRAAFTSSRTDR